MGPQYNDPKALLNDLGITEPGEILVEALAARCRATVVYEQLDGCEARILGSNEEAIITVNSRSSRGRQRFSIAHELGHWMFDRGRVGFACTEANLTEEWQDVNRERRANRYAVDLLLPTHMIAAHARNRPPTLATVRDLAGLFQTSLTATAIRVVEIGSHPAMLVFSNGRGRRWFLRSPLVPKSLWPSREPGRGSVAARILKGDRVAEAEDVDADDWVDHPDARKYCVHEESVGVTRDAVLSLIWWKDENQILDLEGDDDDEE